MVSPQHKTSPFTFRQHASPMSYSQSNTCLLCILFSVSAVSPAVCRSPYPSPSLRSISASSAAFSLLVGVVTVIRKNLDALPIKMFPDCCGTGGAAALPILALTDNVPSVLHGVINECGKSGRFRKISVVGKAVFLQNFKVDVM